MGKMFNVYDEALSEALEFVRGNVKLRTKEIFIPDAPKSYKAKDIKQLRTKLGLTQNEFSAWLNVSLNTVQGWEQGTRNPSHSSLRLLEMFEKDFSFIKRILVNKKSEKKSPEKKIGSSSSSYSKSNMVAKAKH